MMPGFPPHFTRALFLITEITLQRDGEQARRKINKY